MTNCIYDVKCTDERTKCEGCIYNRGLAIRYSNATVTSESKYSAL